MHKPTTMKALEELGRVRLSRHFFMREMLYSEIGNFHGIPNIPDDPDLAIAAGTKLCEEILEPLHATFGHVTVRSAFRSVTVNQFGVEHRDQGYSCGATEWNYGRHVWDHRDADGNMGATACVIIPWFVERYDAGTPWQAMAWWVHDHLPYSHMLFYPTFAAFNVNWRENPLRSIDSMFDGRKCLTEPGMDNHGGDHSAEYPGFPALKRPS
jgi:hypothetical protein